MIERDSLLIRDLPDPEAALRFLGQLEERSATNATKLMKNEPLLSDVLTLVAYSPLLATTLLQNPDYFAWLDRERKASGVRSKEELLESLARFSSTNSQIEPQVLFARFRRRELLKIYLKDIRRLATIPEITEEISNLADAVLESALRLAQVEMDNRFGQPQQTDEKGRATQARFCIAALGKLGSRELNYSSDIDLIFIYSSEGTTSGSGTRGAVTNREYFVKLAEYVTKLVGQPSGEGAAYRVDLRLRPHGTLGALALSTNDMVRYYETEARAWERQVMIRSRGSAGEIELFKQFSTRIEHLVFSDTETVETALESVRRSKEKIDTEQIGRKGFNVKLGPGGIREIEFIAQALQLAHGGRDPWLRSSHTLISLDRLSDRGYLLDKELTELAAAYDFLRRTEHVLQMENGVQTHTVPDDIDRLKLLAARMDCKGTEQFSSALQEHSEAVRQVFTRVFGDRPAIDISSVEEPSIQATENDEILTSVQNEIVERLTRISPHFATRIAANPTLVRLISDPNKNIDLAKYSAALMSATNAGTFRERLLELRRTWSRHLLDIVIQDVFETIEISETKRLQSALAEASIAAAIEIVRLELEQKYDVAIPSLSLRVLALGKLGGRGVDYDSDLDLIFVYDDEASTANGVTHAEFYGRAVELFVTVMSSMTREGHLYRVDLRLRPYGSKGLSAMSSSQFLSYIRDTAAVWEMLAFVKLRAVGGDISLAEKVESETRRIIHERAVATDADELRSETIRVRLALEEQRSRTRRGGDIDIKYGEGGMLDVYFAMRYLQLAKNIPDNYERSTAATLERLSSDPSLSDLRPNLINLRESYAFLAALDHNLRLTVGRTTRVPLANTAALSIIAERMNQFSTSELIEKLTTHRLAIREAFEGITATG